MDIAATINTLETAVAELRKLQSFLPSASVTDDLLDNLTSSTSSASAGNVSYGYPADFATFVPSPILPNNHTEITNQIAVNFGSYRALIEYVLRKHKDAAGIGLSGREIADRILHTFGVTIRPVEVNKRIWELEELCSIAVDRVSVSYATYKLYRIV